MTRDVPRHLFNPKDRDLVLKTNRVDGQLIAYLKQ